MATRKPGKVKPPTKPRKPPHVCPALPTPEEIEAEASRNYHLGFEAGRGIGAMDYQERQAAKLGGIREAQKIIEVRRRDWASDYDNSLFGRRYKLLRDECAMLEEKIAQLIKHLGGK